MAMSKFLRPSPRLDVGASNIGKSASSSMLSAAKSLQTCETMKLMSLPLKVSVLDDGNVLFTTSSRLGRIYSVRDDTSYAESASSSILDDLNKNDLGISKDRLDSRILPFELASDVSSHIQDSFESKRLQKRSRRDAERKTYLVAAILSSVGFTALAGGAVFYRFFFQMQPGTQISYIEMLATFSLAIGAAVGMEFWARWAHKALWHDSLWSMHESHHRPRDGPFELNDIFAIINAFPAILLLAYGFFHTGIVAGLSFGAGLGITLFGMAYMFVHDGLVHRRFPIGPVAKVPYLQRVAAAHQLHHADKYEGVPFGLFLGPQELREVGGLEDLEAVLKLRQQQLKE